jgi:hypothetical protein
VSTDDDLGPAGFDDSPEDEKDPKVGLSEAIEIMEDEAFRTRLVQDALVSSRQRRRRDVKQIKRAVACEFWARIGRMPAFRAWLENQAAIVKKAAGPAGKS